MSIQAYINFNGNCREAVEFYSKVFKTNEPQFTLFGDFHDESDFVQNDAAKNLVLNTKLLISGTIVMFSDVPPGIPFVQGNNINLAIVTKDETEIRSAYERLKEDGVVLMELQETFWSTCFGCVTDKFGITWQLSLESDK